MNFLVTLLRGIAFIPAIVTGLENLFGGRTGAEKKDAALTFVGAALNLTQSILNKDIMDEGKFKDGLSKIIDGVVACLNASVWFKGK
ncbi:MAG TPA: hypothetical protein VE825_01500 [Terriglobales bacterium]|jgi:hypothetical protein|nr:hypothetical protein [Terriglobales bacterium]